MSLCRQNTRAPRQLEAATDSISISAHLELYSLWERSRLPIRGKVVLIGWSATKVKNVSLPGPSQPRLDLDVRRDSLLVQCLSPRGGEWESVMQGIDSTSGVKFCSGNSKSELSNDKTWVVIGSGEVCFSHL